MNGYLFFISIIYLIRWQLSGQSKPLLSGSFWLSVQKSLKARDYLLRQVLAETATEGLLLERLREDIKKGSIKLEDLAALGEFYASSRRQQLELLGLLNSYVTHLSFVLLVPLGIRLLISGQYLFFRDDFASLVGAFLGLMLIAVALQRYWPVASFARADALWDFVRAYLGDKDCGRFAADLEVMSRQAWMSGLDSGQERKDRLREWQLHSAAQFDQRQSFLENCLGPAELGMSCFFGLVLLGQPMLSHFRYLLRG